MKLLKQLFPVFIILALWSSCTTDDSPIPGVIAPSSSISSSSETIMANGTFNVTLTALSGDSPLNTLTIQKDGANVATSDVTIDGTQIASAVILLLNADKTSLSYDIGIQTDLMQGESAIYSFIIDADNNDNTTETVSVDVPVSMDPPVLDYNGDIITQSTFWQIPLTATMGSDSMATIAVYENGVLAESSRISLGAMTVWSVNPYTLPSDLKGTFTNDLLLDLPTANGDYEYWVIVADAAGLSDTVAFAVTGFVVGTPTTGGVAGITMENFAGPNPTGGLDCTTGAVSGNNAAAHIKDRGNDVNTGEWASQIEIGGAGAELRSVTGVFGDFEYTEDIVAAYDAGTTGSSFTVQVGDLFVVLGTDAVYYLVEFTGVNNTVGDNLDSYVVNTKF